MKTKTTKWVVTEANHNEYQKVKMVTLGIFDSKEDAVNAATDSAKQGGKGFDNFIQTEEDTTTELAYFNEIDGCQCVYHIQPVEVKEEQENDKFRAWLDETLIRFGAAFLPILCRRAQKSDLCYDTYSACNVIGKLAKEFETELDWQANEGILDYEIEIDKFVKEHVDDVWEESQL